jgi:transposase
MFARRSNGASARQATVPWALDWVAAVAPVEERLRFVARLLESEGMSDVCREFGISRKTGYKIFNRYKDDGLEALTDRSRRPVRYPNQLPEPVEAMIVSYKKNKPHWGARKIRELLVKRLAGDVRVPAKSTVHAVLDRHGLIAHARKRQDVNGLGKRGPSRLRDQSAVSCISETLVTPPGEPTAHDFDSSAERRYASGSFVGDIGVQTFIIGHKQGRSWPASKPFFCDRLPSQMDCIRDMAAIEFFRRPENLQQHEIDVTALLSCGDIGAVHFV